MSTTQAAPLVERLRTRPTGDPYLHMMVHEAADEIERLRAVIERARSALAPGGLYEEVRIELAAALKD